MPGSATAGGGAVSSDELSTSIALAIAVLGMCRYETRDEPTATLAHQVRPGRRQVAVTALTSSAGTGSQFAMRSA